MTALSVGVRWTVGDVSDRGFQALRLSILGARRIFGADAAYVVAVNGMAPEAAAARCGGGPDGVAFYPAGPMPAPLSGLLDEGMAEGVAWKLAPARLFPDRWELSLDNDCILWSLPPSITAWLAEGGSGRCLLAEDTTRAFGRFDALCGPMALNAGIRGLPPGLDLEAALARVLDRCPGPLASELDEQGLQAAALSLDGAPFVVTLEEVSLCAPFWPKRPELGRHGAHFTGLNARSLPWDWYDRPASDCQNENFDRHRPAIERLVSAG